jgi:hypothetical protein
VNAYTTEEQYSSVIAGTGAGGFVVVWQSFMQVGLDFDIFGRRFDANGVPAGVEFQVNTYTTYRQAAPRVAAGSSGEFVVVWQGYEQDGSHWGIFGQRFDAAGLPTGGEFQVNSSTADVQYGPAVAKDQAGNFLVTWTGFGEQGYGYDVFGQRFDASGAPLGSEFRINSYTTDSQNSSSVARAGTGGFVVSWSSNAQDGSYGGIFGQRVTSGLFADGFEAGDACAWSAVVGGGCPLQRVESNSA